MSHELIIGIVGGLLSAVIVFLVGLLIKKVVLPSITAYLYQGPNLSGQWKCYDASEENAECTGTAEINQKGEKVKATLRLVKSRAGRPINKQFQYEGRLASGQLTLLFEDTSLKRFAIGAVVVKLSPDNQTMSGKTTYFDHGLNKVVAHDLWLRRTI